MILTIERNYAFGPLGSPFPDTHRYGLNCVPLPQQRHVQVLSSSTCACDLIWKQGLCRYNQIKIRSLGQACIQCDSYPYKRKIWTQIETQGKCHVNTETEPGGWERCSCKSEHSGWLANRHKLEEVGKDPPYNFHREHGCVDTLIWISSPENCEILSS